MINGCAVGAGGSDAIYIVRIMFRARIALVIQRLREINRILLHVATYISDRLYAKTVQLRYHRTC